MVLMESRLRYELNIYITNPRAITKTIKQRSIPNKLIEKIEWLPKITDTGKSFRGKCGTRNGWEKIENKEQDDIFKPNVSMYILM